MSINNADVIKLLRSDRSSDTRALLFYFIIIILFYFILFYFILFYFILFYFILFYFILFYFILFYFILFYFILFYFILFYFILFYFILFYFILFYFIFVKLLNTSHCSPPPSSLSPPQPALFAEVRTLPIFQHFSSKSLSFNMTYLGLNVSDNIRCDVINSYLLT